MRLNLIDFLYTYLLIVGNVTNLERFNFELDYFPMCFDRKLMTLDQLWTNLK